MTAAFIFVSSLYGFVLCTGHGGTTAFFGSAWKANAAAIILAHQHPSGNPEPSREDIRITRQLVEAGKLMGVPVHDHLIIAENGYVSLAERGLLGS